MQVTQLIASAGLIGAALATPVARDDIVPTANFKTEMLNGHNWYRAQHAATALTWDAEAAKIAQAKADKCVFAHDDNTPQYGENIAYHTRPETWSHYINAWGGERTKYDYNKPGLTDATGHFTQVVWKSSTGLGCGYTKCSFGLYVICYFKPPGNYKGKFPANVAKQTSGKPTDTYVGK